jgi:hypothetical protein
LDKTWDTAYTGALSGMAGCCNDPSEYTDILYRLMAHVKDSHIIYTWGHNYRPDAEFIFIGDSLYVKSTGNNLADKMKKWDRVIAVNNEPFEKWLSSKLAITTASTHQSALSRKN